MFLQSGTRGGKRAFVAYLRDHPLPRNTRLSGPGRRRSAGKENVADHWALSGRGPGREVRRGALSSLLSMADGGTTNPAFRGPRLAWAERVMPDDGPSQDPPRGGPAAGPYPGLCLDLPLGVHPVGSIPGGGRSCSPKGCRSGLHPTTSSLVVRIGPSPPFILSGSANRVTATLPPVSGLRCATAATCASITSCLYIVCSGSPRELSRSMASMSSTQRMSCTRCCVWNLSDTARWSRAKIWGPSARGAPAMRRHGVLRTWVFQASLRPRTVAPVPRATESRGRSEHARHVPAGRVSAGRGHPCPFETGQLDRERARRELAARARLVARLRSLFSNRPG